MHWFHKALIRNAGKKREKRALFRRISCLQHLHRNRGRKSPRIPECHQLPYLLPHLFQGNAGSRTFLMPGRRPSVTGDTEKLGAAAQQSLRSLPRQETGVGCELDTLSKTPPPTLLKSSIISCSCLFKSGSPVA